MSTTVKDDMSNPTRQSQAGRWQSILTKICLIQDNVEEDRLLRQLTSTDSPVVVAFVNAHAMNALAVDSAFFDAVVSADVLLRDGSGMAVLCRALDMPAGLNMNGTDLIPKILESFRGRRVALWGTVNPYLQKAVTRCEQEFGVSVVSVSDGFSAAEHYVDLARQHLPDLIVMGMGMPKQEVIAQQLRSAMPQPVVIVCGGAIIDFLGGRFPRAPTWMSRMGIEWLFRLSKEPVRLFRRYVVGNPLFMLRVLNLKKNRKL